jgi:hypothetical protein
MAIRFPNTEVFAAPTAKNRVILAARVAEQQSSKVEILPAV